MSKNSYSYNSLEAKEEKGSYLPDPPPGNSQEHDMTVQMLTQCWLYRVGYFQQGFRERFGQQHIHMGREGFEFLGALAQD